MDGVTSLRWWDVAAVAAAVLVVALGLIAATDGARSSWGTVAVLLALLALYAAVGRPALRNNRHWTHALTTALAAALMAVAVWYHPVFATIQIFLYPLVWMTAVSVRSAIVANVVFSSGVVVGHLLRSGMAGLSEGLITAALSLGFSLVMGAWISRVEMVSQERAELIARLQSVQQELALAHRDAGAVAERGRIAREIHDTIAQSLTGIVMVAQRTRDRAVALGGPGTRLAADVGVIEDLARDALGEARGLVTVLSPVTLDTTLVDALTRLGERFARETGVRVEVDVEAVGIGREREVMLLRAAQEGLANVRKHSRAESVRIEVVAETDRVRLTVTDDGVGPAGAVDSSGFGIGGLRDRLAPAGGSVELGAGGSGGACLTVTLPVEEPGAAGAGTDRPAARAASDGAARAAVGTEVQT